MSENLSEASNEELDAVAGGGYESSSMQMKLEAQARKRREAAEATKATGVAPDPIDPARG